MVESTNLRTFRLPAAKRLPPLPAGLRRTRPRDFVEWRTLRRWGKLPDWESVPIGYVLRDLREGAGLTQRELATNLGCSQQAIAQAERWNSNPTVSHLRRWAESCGKSLAIVFD